MNVYDILKERGYIAQATHEEEIRSLLEKEKITFYIGFDPTADSLHVGHFLGMMVMAHMQRAGHRPICLIGGGTGTVGDPSGRTDMRSMMTPEQICHNCDCFKEQMSKLFHADNVLLHKANRPFFNDVNDHLQFVLQTLDGCRDMISALVDLYLSNNDQRMNNIMKQLTIVSTIFIPLTFLAGIWGMNFEWMPELGWKYGYLMAWGLMLVTGIGVYLFFKRKKWY